MPREDSFSRRHGYSAPAKEITVREDAPEGLRFVVLQTARDLEWSPTPLRGIVCKVLRVRPDPGNWSEYPNIWVEVQGLASPGRSASVPRCRSPEPPSRCRRLAARIET